MDVTIKEMVTNIKKASECENLVVFIGAGVSVNSGYKLWDSLIGLFNKELKFSQKTSQFSTDEMLKIPQYFFNENRERYYKIIKEEYGKLPNQTNIIIDEILDLNPVHIITTNFDLLIEKSIEDNHIYGSTVYGSLGKYSIIRSDNDFIDATKKHYLIKMHGDVESLDNLVLKEEDYLQYSMTHTLIETFIKSLFVNHTILFVGYGLGDYNIKLIMSWVDGILQKQRKEKTNNCVSYYFINSGQEPLKDYEKNYYKRQSIFVIESSDISDDFTIVNDNSNSLELEDIKGNNLLRICRYIKNGRDNDLNEIRNDLSVFDNIDCITVKELMSKLDEYIGHHNMYDNTLSYRKNFQSPKLKTIIDILFDSQNSKDSIYFTSIFKKAGIHTIVPDSVNSDNNQIINLNDVYEKIDDLYTNVIECNIKQLYELCKEPCGNQRAMLRKGYIYSILNDEKSALTLFEELVNYYILVNDFFHLLICQQNMGKVNIGDRHTWYLLKNSLSERDRDTFKTLYDYLDNSDEIYQKTVEAYKFLEKKFDVNCHSIHLDEDNVTFLSLRYYIHQIQKYFIQNNVYIKGYSGSTIIIGNWIKTLDLYVDLLLMLHSSNIKMHREKRTYKRNALKKQDLYILINHPRTEDLKYILKRYNVKQIELEDGGADYIISVLNNYVDAFEFPNILNFKLANDLKNILSLIPHISFKSEQYEDLFRGLTNLLQQIMATHFDKKDYFFTVFRDVPIEILECIFSLLHSQKDNVKEGFLKNIIENTLLSFANTATEENIGMPVLQECGILLNFSTALEFHYKETISEDITNKFFEIVLDKYSNVLNRFIIEIFPILSEQQKIKWREFAENLEIEPCYIRFGIINGIFNYNDELSEVLINLCKQQVKEKSPEKEKNLHLKPLYTVLRLVEQDYVTDIESYREFIGHYDFFDFVCFPNDFDYKNYDTNWGSWLTLKKYRELAFKTDYETLKTKYIQAMKDGPSDTEKSIYYKYFYLEGDSQ